MGFGHGALHHDDEWPGPISTRHPGDSSVSASDGVTGATGIFFRTGVVELFNLQPRANGQAKPYQVRQVRDAIIRYRLTDPLDREPENEA